MKRFSMKKAIPALMAAAVVSTFAVEQAQATISLVITQIPFSSTANSTKLNTNGWMAVKIQLVSTVPSGTAPGITAFDFKNPVSGFTDAPNNPLGITIGITGPTIQSWTETDDGTGNDTFNVNKTPQGALTSLPNSTTTTNLADSFWANYPASFQFASIDAPSENNNLANVSSNPPYTGNPIADKIPVDDGSGAGSVLPGFDNGVGSLMTESGAILGTLTATTLDLAFLIVPKNGSAANGTLVHIFGAAGDSAGADFTINADINGGGSATPEPASIGLMGLGVAGLLARRKRK